MVVSKLVQEVTVSNLAEPISLVDGCWHNFMYNDKLDQNLALQIRVKLKKADPC